MNTTALRTKIVALIQDINTVQEDMQLLYADAAPAQVQLRLILAEKYLEEAKDCLTSNLGD